MDLSGYTAESAAVLKTALSTAKTIYANAALSVNDRRRSTRPPRL